MIGSPKLSLLGGQPARVKPQKRQCVATFAKRLHEVGISSRKDLLSKDNYQNVLDIMGKKRADEAIKNAVFE